MSYPQAAITVVGLLVIAALAASAASLIPTRSRYGGVHRHKRSSEHIIRDCMHVTSESGHFFFKSTGEDSTVCGIYLMTDPDKIIQVQFDYLDLPCSSGGLVAFVDGWELNGGFFPSENDHHLQLDDRVSEFCGQSRPSRAFLSSQNAAMIQYRVPKRSRGFSFKVSFLKNPTPCNVLVGDLENVYTLRNYGKAVNCSLTSLLESQISILALSVGVSFPGDSFKIETGTMRKCEEAGMKDYVEIIGGSDLAKPELIKGESFCGIDSYPVTRRNYPFEPEAPPYPEVPPPYPENDYGWESYVDAKLSENDYYEREEIFFGGPLVETLDCGVSTVRLVSSGEYDNSLTLGMQQATEPDLLSPTLVCPK